MKQPTFVAALKFASHAMATKDIRYYLNGVLFEFTENDRLFMVGTDGHRMAYIEIQCGLYDYAHDLRGKQFIVKLDGVKQLLSVFKGTNDRHVTIAGHSAESLTVTGSTAAATVYCVDGKFPDWRRVCNATEKPKAVESISFNSGYLADAAKACGALGSGKYAGATMSYFGAVDGVRITPSKISVEVVIEAACVVMPMRD